MHDPAGLARRDPVQCPLSSAQLDPLQLLDQQPVQEPVKLKGEQEHQQGRHHQIGHDGAEHAHRDHHKVCGFVLPVGRVETHGNAEQQGKQQRRHGVFQRGRQAVAHVVVDVDRPSHHRQPKVTPDDPALAQCRQWSPFSVGFRAKHAPEPLAPGAELTHEQNAVVAALLRAAEGGDFGLGRQRDPVGFTRAAAGFDRAPGHAEQVGIELRGHGQVHVVVGAQVLENFRRRRTLAIEGAAGRKALGREDRQQGDQHDHHHLPEALKGVAHEKNTPSPAQQSRLTPE